MAGDPDATMAVSYPAASNPLCARMRTMPPTASDPNPIIVPFPCAGNPKPNRDGAGADRHNFDLGRRRSGVIHDNFAGRLDSGMVAINDLAFHAAGKEGQARGD
jgi:hypothetical protein